MKNLIIAALVATIAAGGALGAFAATRTVETTANVEVRVWRNVTDPGRLHLSTRPAGGRWTTHNERLDMSELSSSGNWHQSNFVTVPVPVSVEVASASPVAPTAIPDSALSIACEWYGDDEDAVQFRGTLTNRSQDTIRSAQVHVTKQEEYIGLTSSPTVRGLETGDTAEFDSSNWLGLTSIFEVERVYVSGVTIRWEGRTGLTEYEADIDCPEVLR